MIEGNPNDGLRLPACSAMISRSCVAVAFVNGQCVPVQFPHCAQRGAFEVSANGTIRTLRCPETIVFMGGERAERIARLANGAALSTAVLMSLARDRSSQVSLLN